MYRRYPGKGRPTHPFSTNQMGVDMQNALQGILAGIKNKPVTGLPDADDLCHDFMMEFLSAKAVAITADVVEYPRDMVTAWIRRRNARP